MFLHKSDVNIFDTFVAKTTLVVNNYSYRIYDNKNQNRNPYKNIYNDIQPHFELVSKKKSLFGSHQIRYSMYIVACYTGVYTK
ncbi:hypothetical protein EMIT019CA3_50065 [Bacillus pseudomycoides]